jgi:hypothetical protein
MTPRWKSPVFIAFEQDGEMTEIASTQAASWALIEDWPEEDGTALDHALLVFAAVDKGKKTHEDARRAFIEAAKEARLTYKA